VRKMGGMIFPDFVWGRDGARAAAQLLHIMATKEKSLEDLLDELPKYYQVKTKVKVDPDKKEKILEKIDRITAQEKSRITIDGYKVILEDGSWVLVRPSGTEPLIRVFAESKDPEKAQKLVNQYLEIIREV